jgi:hypothetical protein
MAPSSAANRAAASFAGSMFERKKRLLEARTIAFDQRTSQIPFAREVVVNARRFDANPLHHASLERPRRDLTLWPTCHHPTINGQDGTGNPTRLVTGKKEDRCHDVARLSIASQRM